jgi:integrase/recombinase XerD
MEEPMALEFSNCEVRWERCRRVAENPQAREWLKFQAARGLAANTIEAYGRDLDSYLEFLQSQDVSFESVIRPTIGAYVRSITDVAVPRVRKKGLLARTTLAHATLQQHLTVVRLFHDFLVEERKGGDRGGLAQWEQFGKRRNKEEERKKRENERKA